jgi:hypothetical protein
MFLFHLHTYHTRNVDFLFLNKILHEFLLPRIYDTCCTLPNHPNFIIPVKFVEHYTPFGSSRYILLFQYLATLLSSRYILLFQYFAILLSPRYILLFQYLAILLSPLFTLLNIHKCDNSIENFSLYLQRFAVTCVACLYFIWGFRMQTSPRIGYQFEGLHVLSQSLL